MSSDTPVWRQPRTHLIALAVLLIGALVAVGVVAANLGQARTDLADHASKVAELEEEAARLEEELDDETARADQAEEAARVEMEAELEQRTQELTEELEAAAEEREQALDAREAELDDREETLASQEADLQEREGRLERVLQDSFGNGTWEVGVDINPGRYRTDPGSDCYWARLRDSSGDFSAIITNANPRGGQEIVTIASSDGYFESTRCGQWTPID